ncbi:MAG: hypothetical protein PVF70_06885 [Anaerolineales bacterium]|jgi:hypothetical protein
MVLFIGGPPITAHTGGLFCELEVWPSDCQGTSDQAEAAIHAAL